MRVRRPSNDPLDEEMILRKPTERLQDRPEGELTPEEIKKQRNRLAKRAERQRAKDAKVAEVAEAKQADLKAELSKASSREEFWAINRKYLPPDQLQSMLVRENDVEGDHALMRMFIRGEWTIDNEEDREILESLCEHTLSATESVRRSPARSLTTSSNGSHHAS